MKDALFYICILLISLCVVALAKNVVTYYWYKKIFDAIYEYRKMCIYNSEQPKVNYTDVESYASTFCRVWDWWYRSILPKDKLDIIKPFMK